MPNALDMFREQRAAAGDVCARLQEVCDLLGGLQNRVNALTRIDELQSLLQQEQSWLEKAQRTLVEIRALHDEDEIRRSRPGVMRRCALAVVFALASATAAGRRVRVGHAALRA